MNKELTTLPGPIREAAAIAAEKVVQFDQGDFGRIVDAITPALAAYFIEQGATKAAEEMGLYFCDEDSESSVPNITTADIESFAKDTVAGIMHAVNREQGQK